MLADKLFRKILVANRGEIAVRIIRACKELDIPTVAVYSEADRASLHLALADEAYCIGSAPASRSYLKAETLIDLAHKTGADAIHPGYGFLSESSDFAEQCRAAGITFIGPNPDAIRSMSIKTTGRAIAASCDIPLLPGMQSELLDEELEKWALKTGYPLMVKAVNGSAGKGLRKVQRPEDLAMMVKQARSEAFNSFGDRSVYLEHYLEKSSHIEVQILGDKQGNIVHFMERDCSIKHRNQKMVVEAPSPLVDDNLRKKLTEAAVRVAKQINYDSAGTVKFLVLAETGEFFFLGMQTAVADLDAVTEAICGVDFCKQMIRVAAGKALPFKQDEIAIRGHAIGFNICAEDADNNFLPCSGKISSLRTVGGSAVRDDSCLYENLELPIYYDRQLSKLIIWGSSRKACLGRAKSVLDEYFIKGIKNTLSFCKLVIHSNRFVAADYDTDFVEQVLASKEDMEINTNEDIALLALAVKVFINQKNSTLKPTVAVTSRESAWKMTGRIIR